MEPFPQALAKQLRGDGIDPRPGLRIVHEVWEASGLPITSASRLLRPEVYAIRPPTPDTLGGRYFPSLGVALIYEHQDPLVVKGTAVHETSHAIGYATKCYKTNGKMKTKCGYYGQHNKAFYEIVEPLYREFGIPVRVAMAIESDCRGDYQCPARWRKLDRF